MRTSIPEAPEVLAHRAVLARLRDILHNNTELLQRLDPQMLSGAGLEHIRSMDPDILRKSDIHAPRTKDLSVNRVTLSMA